MAISRNLDSKSAAARDDLLQMVLGSLLVLTVGVILCSGSQAYHSARWVGQADNCAALETIRNHPGISRLQAQMACRG